MHRNKSVNVHQFAMVPRADIPRSSFRIQSTHKTTFDAGYLVPVYVDEVLPGDTFNLRMTAFARLTTPLFPIMDNMYLESFFFFVPNRLVWDNWVRFMGEQDDPGDSISFVIPIQSSPVGGYAVGSLQDHFGLPTVGQVDPGGAINHSALPLRAYNLIFNKWFKDENLIADRPVDRDDGPDTVTDYIMCSRMKRHDYFTSCLPFTQKGAAVQMSLGTSAPVVGNPADNNIRIIDGGAGVRLVGGVNATQTVQLTTVAAGTGPFAWPTGTTVGTGTGLIVDLTSAVGPLVNSIRTSFQIQKLLERDARGGTRYTEIVRSHFGVLSPDARLQRPEYLGGGSTPIHINPVAQTSGTAIEGSDTPLGELGAIGTALAAGHGFTQSFTEHGIIIGLVNVRCDLTYQQGIRRFWSRSTRYDFYFPVFAMLGEQAVLNREIYATGNGINDPAVFGYQERWAEYRYFPSLITGLFRSTSASNIDEWHLAQHFTALPTLNGTFMVELPPVDRIIAIGAGANGKQFLGDFFFDVKAARPMPLYSVPGMMDHF